jgi:hypothetical protein
MSYLHYLCLFAYSGVQHILCLVFFGFLRLVYPMLPVFLDCPFMIAPTVFFNVYLLIGMAGLEEAKRFVIYQIW